VLATTDESPRSSHLQNNPDRLCCHVGSLACKLQSPRDSQHTQLGIATSECRGPCWIFVSVITRLREAQRLGVRPSMCWPGPDSLASARLQGSVVRGPRIVQIGPDEAHVAELALVDMTVSTGTRR